MTFELPACFNIFNFYQRHQSQRSYVIFLYMQWRMSVIGKVCSINSTSILLISYKSCRSHSTSNSRRKYSWMNCMENICKQSLKYLQHHQIWHSKRKWSKHSHWFWTIHILIAHFFHLVTCLLFHISVYFIVSINFCA